MARLDVGFIQVCLDGTGEIVVGDVGFVEEINAIAVTEFATLPMDLASQQTDMTSDPTTLSEAGWDPAGPQVVSTVCPTGVDEQGELLDGDLTWLAFTVVGGPDDVDVRAGEGLEIQYRSSTGGDTRSLIAPYSYYFCDSFEVCDEWRESRPS